MSIARMISLGNARNIERQTVVRTAAAGEDDKKTGGPDLEKIAAFIPSEIIAVYVALLGLVAPDTIKGKWVIFGVGLVAVLVFVFINHALQRKKTPAGKSLLAGGFRSLSQSLG